MGLEIPGLLLSARGHSAARWPIACPYRLQIVTGSTGRYCGGCRWSAYLVPPGSLSIQGLEARAIVSSSRRCAALMDQDDQIDDRQPVGRHA